MSYLENIGKNAKKAFEDLKKIKHTKIKNVLENYNKSLLKNKKKIIKENLKDVKNVKRKHLVDRLILNDKRIEGIRYSINQIAKFKNPVGRVLNQWKRPNKLKIKKATSSEFDKDGVHIIGLMNEWEKSGKKVKGTDKNLGGTMRLGSYDAILKDKSKLKISINQN